MILFHFVDAQAPERNERSTVGVIGIRANYRGNSSGETRIAGAIKPPNSRVLLPVVTGRADEVRDTGRIWIGKKYIAVFIDDRDGRGYAGVRIRTALDRRFDLDFILDVHLNGHSHGSGEARPGGRTEGAAGKITRRPVAVGRSVTGAAPTTIT